MRAVERASRDANVPAALQGALRAFASIRGRSGNDPDDRELDDHERELRALLPRLFGGDAAAHARAYAIVRRLLTNTP